MAMDVPRLYALADADRDGKISGAEAVRFLQKSGLSNEVLGQVRVAVVVWHAVVPRPCVIATMHHHELVVLLMVVGGLR